MTETSDDTTTLTTPSDRETVITRIFDAPRELVFEAMTRPEHVKRWWGIRSTTLVVCDIDLRPGGRWRYVLRDESGQEFGFSGEYREIDPPARIVSTEEFEPMPGTEYVVTMTLEEVDGKTKMTSHLLYQSAQHRDGHLASGMESGMRETFDRLAELLEELS